MALPPTATDMPQNEVYENHNLGNTELNRGIRLTTGSIRFAALAEKTSCRLLKKIQRRNPRDRVCQNVIENSERARTRNTNTNSSEAIERNAAC
jgi:hypothetical protein